MIFKKTLKITMSSITLKTLLSVKQDIILSFNNINALMNSNCRKIDICFILLNKNLELLHHIDNNLGHQSINQPNLINMEIL